MLLAIDIGNTNSVFGIFSDGELLTHWRLTSAMTRTVDESWITVKLLCEEEGIRPDALDSVIIGSVVPNVTDVFATMGEKYLAIDPVIVDASLPLDLNILYEDPKQVGADRICNAIAGKALYDLPQVILDFGTATTFDVLNGNGDYMGGIIMPGFEISARDLFSKAARLFKVDLHFPEKVIGTNTEESMQSGILYGAVDSINGMIRRIRNSLGTDDMDVIVTGGIGKLLLPHIEDAREYNPDLTLYGLQLIYEQVG
ncbi:MAG: type III pantothenate kinase [Candidatus Marinimicrobia bacterium]|nr:type III pantothenate kinase [Candidatus Neomarinimicrobiota bacterium]MCF7829175.1 type III pantothenate kinase [Candidatus Neomarinimicrobiota bacterium]MCF7881172.1 type III pantothenate kinase [Candidatus Neomarinimicrobiota bacterium]